MWKMPIPSQVTINDFNVIPAPSDFMHPESLYDITVQIPHQLPRDNQRDREQQTLLISISGHRQ